jgi:hypothetical protein
VREQVALGRIRVLHVPTAQQFADVMTKGLPTSTFEEFRSSLCVSGAASTAGGVEYIVYVYIVSWAHLLVHLYILRLWPPSVLIYTCLVHRSMHCDCTAHTCPSTVQLEIRVHAD